MAQRRSRFTSAPRSTSGASRASTHSSSSSRPSVASTSSPSRAHSTSTASRPSPPPAAPISRPSVPASTRPSPTASRPAPAPSRTVPATTAPQSHPPAMQQPSSGFGGGMMANIATAAAGSFIGNMMARTVFGAFGGSGDDSGVSTNDQGQPIDAHTGQVLNEDQLRERNKCYDQSLQFMSCLNQYGEGNLGACQNYYDQMISCQRNYYPQQAAAVEDEFQQHHGDNDNFASGFDAKSETRGFF